MCQAIYFCTNVCGNRVCTNHNKHNSRFWLPHCHRQRRVRVDERGGLTSLADLDWCRTTNSRVSQQWNDGYDIAT